MNIPFISIAQLSYYKIYIGHNVSNLILLSSWLIFSIRGQITILNLYHTIKMLKLCYTLLQSVINHGFPFWFINFDLTKEELIKYNSFVSGEFYVTRKWIRGMMSNYFVITKAYRQYLIKKDYIESNKVKDLYGRWILTRFTWPRTIFISNVKSCFIASKEAASARIPSIALVDTDVKTFVYNVPIPCNDDTLEAIGFMNNLMSQYILRFKYKKVLVWYFFNRNIKRYQTILDWVKNLIKLKKNIMFKYKFKDCKLPTFIDYFTQVKAGLSVFLGRSHTFKLVNKVDDVYDNNFFIDLFYNLNKTFIYNRLKYLNYKSLAYKYRLKYKRYYNLDKIEGLSSFKSFLNNFIRFNGLFNKRKRLKIKKRIKMGRRNVSINFRKFFYFIFFFYLNKFNIIIDVYNKKNFNLLNLIKLSKNSIKRKNKNKYQNTEFNNNKFKYSYFFKYKSKIIHRKLRKKKYGYIYTFSNNIIEANNISFLFFYWKYFIIFLGLRLRLRSKFKVLSLKKTNFIKK